MFPGWGPSSREERSAIWTGKARPRVTGLAYRDVLNLEHADAEGMENLPRQGVRWRRTDEGWERWSFMDEAWVDDRTPRPPDLPDEVAIGTIVSQDETGDWTEASDPAATVEWPD
jgi:hypothetical protein